MPIKKKVALIAGALLASRCVTVLAQENTPTPLFVTEAKADYTAVKNDLLRAADKMPEADYSFQATSSVRTFGALVAHVTEVQAWVCGTLLGSRSKPAEQGKTKADLVAALKVLLRHMRFRIRFRDRGKSVANHRHRPSETVEAGGVVSEQRT